MLVEAVGVLATLVAVISFPILKLSTSLSAAWISKKLGKSYHLLFGMIGIATRK